MKKSPDLTEVFHALDELTEDSTAPRNVKGKIEEIRKILQDSTDVSIRVNKVMNELEEISQDTNLQPFTRTQIWNVISLLEKL